eukprot:CAMPEP_0184719928 /NCGR_PEP_ID=MMETSP0314-20130426/9742_1 /TAXON_ID=38298 /ORGANISM="Rhodella maculata, Strain CCMP 736" /LENGTH=60 /DNA_ID=CAMNT_0027183891 /DNA_START=172 /DNA_END=350 /DNA_ORIENTATION=-
MNGTPAFDFLRTPESLNFRWTALPTPDNHAPNASPNPRQSIKESFHSLFTSSPNLAHLTP